MVTLVGLTASVGDRLLLAATVLERLDPQRRVAVILALIGLCLLGVTMIVLTMLGARWARGPRLGPGPPSRPEARRKRSSRRGKLEDAHATRDTLAGPDAGDQTKVDP